MILPNAKTTLWLLISFLISSWTIIKSHENPSEIGSHSTSEQGNPKHSSIISSLVEPCPSSHHDELEKSGHTSDTTENSILSKLPHPLESSTDADQEPLTTFKERGVETGQNELSQSISSEDLPGPESSRYLSKKQALDVPNQKDSPAEQYSTSRMISSSNEPSFPPINLQTSSSRSQQSQTIRPKLLISSPSTQSYQTQSQVPCDYMSSFSRFSPIKTLIPLLTWMINVGSAILMIYLDLVIIHHLVKSIYNISSSLVHKYTQSDLILISLFLMVIVRTQIYTQYEMVSSSFYQGIICQSTHLFYTLSIFFISLVLYPNLYQSIISRRTGSSKTNTDTSSDSANKEKGLFIMASFISSFCLMFISSLEKYIANTLVLSYYIFYHSKNQTVT